MPEQSVNPVKCSGSPAPPPDLFPESELEARTGNETTDHIEEVEHLYDSMEKKKNAVTNM